MSHPTPPTQSNRNYVLARTGVPADWRSYQFAAPFLPQPVIGKFFLHDLLGLNGCEISLNVLKPGGGMPFLHKHREHEEVYLFLAGYGQFQVDDETFAVQTGDIIRVLPDGERVWRNTSDTDLVFVVFQAKAGTVPVGGTADGVGVRKPVVWPE